MRNERRRKNCLRKNSFPIQRKTKQNPNEKKVAIGILRGGGDNFSSMFHTTNKVNYVHIWVGRGDFWFFLYFFERLNITAVCEDYIKKNRIIDESVRRPIRPWPPTPRRPLRPWPPSPTLDVSGHSDFMQVLFYMQNKRQDKINKKDLKWTEEP